MSHEIKKLIANMGNIQLLKAFRMGFEFEFHKLDGIKRDELESTEYDYADCDVESLRNDSEQALHNASSSELEDMLLPPIYGNATRQEAVRLLKALFNHVDFWDMNTLLNNLPSGQVTNEMQAILEQIQDSWREAWESDTLDNNPGDYYPTRKADYDFTTDGLPLELGTDSSVTGGEIRTLGGLTVSQFIQCAKHVFSHDFEVDHGCSFHIHLSIPGVKHTYGKAFQANMMEYLLNNMSQLPPNVVKRLQSSSIRWCRPELKEEKYTLIHKHSQGTWEFRLFGNITSTKEAAQCLMLACKAVQYAYKLQLDSKEQDLIQKLTRADLTFSEVATEAIACSGTFRESFRTLAKGKTIRAA
jgi:hypothetical protein